MGDASYQIQESEVFEAAMIWLKDIGAVDSVYGVSGEKLTEAIRSREDLIRDFIAQVEGCNFTDHLGHRMEMNEAYRVLKASVGA